MYRLFKNFGLPLKRIFSTNCQRVDSTNTFFNINKKNFFKKTNLLNKKDYYSKISINF